MDSAPLPALKSVRHFSEVWSHIAAEQQVVQALHRGPENAGPLNAQADAALTQPDALPVPRLFAPFHGANGHLTVAGSGKHPSHKPRSAFGAQDTQQAIDR